MTPGLQDPLATLGELHAQWQRQCEVLWRLVLCLGQSGADARAVRVAQTLVAWFDDVGPPDKIGVKSDVKYRSTATRLGHSRHARPHSAVKADRTKLILAIGHQALRRAQDPRALPKRVPVVSLDHSFLLNPIPDKRRQQSWPLALRRGRSGLEPCCAR